MYQEKKYCPKRSKNLSMYSVFCWTIYGINRGLDTCNASYSTVIISPTHRIQIVWQRRIVFYPTVVVYLRLCKFVGYLLLYLQRTISLGNVFPECFMTMPKQEEDWLYSPNMRPYIKMLFRIKNVHCHQTGLSTSSDVIFNFWISKHYILTTTLG